MSDLSPRVIAARRAAIDRLSQGKVETALTELASDLRERPASPEQALFLDRCSKGSESGQTLIKMLASALLEDGDLDGAVAAIRVVTGNAPDTRVIFLTHHPDLATFCRSSGLPTAFADGFEIEAVSKIEQADSPHHSSSVSGLPSGIVVGGSFGPASTSGLAFWNRTIFNPNRAIRHDAVDLLPPLAVASSTRCLARIRDVKTYGPAIAIGDSPNFGHWLLNHAARLALIDNRPDLKPLPLVISTKPSGFVLETLERLGRNPDHVIRVPPDELARFEMLWVPDMPICGRLNDRNIYVSRRALGWVRDVLGAHTCKAANLRIFVSRAGATRRRILNEHEIFERLQPLGFENVDPAGMPLQRQVELAKQSVCIVGGFGAGMAISYFAPPGTSIVEISHPNPSMRIHNATCRILGQHYVGIESQLAVQGASHINDDVFADPSAVFEAVKSALRLSD